MVSPVDIAGWAVTATTHLSKQKQIAKIQAIPASLKRSLRDFFSKILDVWKSCHIKRYKLDTKIEHRILKASQEDLNNRRNIKKFDRPKVLDEKALNIFATRAKITFGDEVTTLEDKVTFYQEFVPFCSSRLQTYSSEEIAGDLPSPENKLIAIPFVLKGLLRNHIVTFVIDPKSKTIEFYDSKGLSIKDRALDNIDGSFGLKVCDLTTILTEKYKGYSIVENTEKHQHDLYNCGVYVLDYIIRRASGETAETIHKEGKGFSAIEERKKEFLEYYLDGVSPEDAIDDQQQLSDTASKGHPSLNTTISALHDLEDDDGFMFLEQN